MYLLFSSHLHLVSQRWFAGYSKSLFNPLNAELNPICHLLALLGGTTIVVVSRLRVKPLQTSTLLRIQWLFIFMPRHNVAVFEGAEERQLRYLRFEVLCSGQNTPTCSTKRVQQRTEEANKCVAIPTIRTPKFLS